MKKRITNILVGLLISSRALSFDLEINTDIEIPDVCRYLPNKTFPTDFSPICLSAQIAAEAFPPLLPAANQLCMVLEGITAQVGVFQIQVNTAYDICDTELANIEKQMMQGLSEFNLFQTDEISLLNKLSKVNSVDDLYFESVAKDGEYLGQDEIEWQEVYLNINEPEKEFTNNNFFKKVAGSDYLGKSILKNSEQKIIVESLQKKISQTITLKESQDLAARMAGELAFQQTVFNQLIGEYLELESAEAMKELTQERWYQNLLRKREEP